MPTRLHHDFETFSVADLKKVGTSRYARDPSTEPLMCAYAFDDGPVQQWVPEEGQAMPAELREGLLDPHVYKYAWNKPFEWNIWTHCLGYPTPHSSWRDPMVLAFSLSFPGSLDRVGDIIGLTSDKAKIKDGKRLISYFCKPSKFTQKRHYDRRGPITDPELWEEFKLYNRQDVEAERAVYMKLRAYNLPKEEWELWYLDQEINEAGLPINMNVVRNAMEVARSITEFRLREMRELTGLDNPNSNMQLLPWLQDHGYPFEDLKKGHISQALEEAENNYLLERVLELRQEVSKASVKKYNALYESTDDDDLLRYTLQFAGAGRTWRWGGRRYQPQNLARPVSWLEKTQDAAVRDLEYLDAQSIEWLYSTPYGVKPRRSPMDLLSTCVRPVVQAPEGYLLYDADLNAIENRVLGWLARDPKINQVFELNRDPYVDFATYLYGEPYEKLHQEYKNGDKDKRTIAKPGVLGCGYMLGPGETFENDQTGEIEATGLLGYAWNMGVRSFTIEDAKLSVRVWRETFSEAVDFWYAIEKAAKRCIRTGDPVECDRVSFDRKGPFLRMVLPSGRALHYCRPRIEMRPTPWKEMRATITYEGLDTRDQWVRIQTHPGKLTENADQAISRDLLAHGIRLAKQRGLDIRLHVHDQIVGVAPEDDAEEHLKILQECMSEQPEWARDLPLASAGFTSRIFVKD
jgi:Casjensviridae DNA polymerase